MLTRSDIATHPALPVVLRRQAATFLQVETEAPRAAAVFAAQQRYLLAQLALAMAFRNERGCVLLTHYLEAVATHGIASRNTADTFIKEMVKYGLVGHAKAQDDRRARPLVVSNQALRHIDVWMVIHLTSLDALDAGDRCAFYRNRPDFLKQVHPRIVDRLLASRLTTRPEGTFSLFGWMNDGGLVMDKMIAMLDDYPLGSERIPTRIASFEDLAQPLRITRAHLSRKMAIAEKIGSIGWAGKRGASPLWLSNAFMAEYHAYQADKLACIDEAFDEASAMIDRA